ncbi:MAG TPA: transglutaminase family protein [Steroidobacteraceae bacterium]|nr:transglutaminase family protein [Steroidobacteraceae bacterium]
MSRKYRVVHETSYKYVADVMHSHHLLHLVPRPAPYQQCLEHEIQIEPATHRRVDQLDAFGNPLVRIELAQPHRELTVTSRMQIEVHARPAVSPETTDPWEKVRDAFAYRGAWPSRDQLDAARFRHESPHVRVKQSFTDYSAACFTEGRPILACAEALSTKLHADISYAPGVTTISTSPTEVLESRRGVCQDFAHFMISCLRSRGLPARYVSGYLRTNATQGEGGEKLVGDAASHAWVSVWSPPYGWIEFDPTNGCFAGTDHIAVAWGRDFGDVSPLRGVILGGADHQLSVTVRVEPEGEPN